MYTYINYLNSSSIDNKARAKAKACSESRLKKLEKTKLNILGGLLSFAIAFLGIKSSSSLLGVTKWCKKFFQQVAIIFRIKWSRKKL